MAIENTGYTMLHVHSDYSLLDSCTDFKEYVDLIKADGGSAIASTEHGLPRGWVSKKLYCDSVGVKFIHGVEIYLTRSLSQKERDNYHTVLLAKNIDGVKELNRLVSSSSDEQHKYYVNRLSFEEFVGISPNIITTSACLASPLNRLSEDDPWFQKLLDRYDYLEVQPHAHPEQIEFNKKLERISFATGKHLVAGTDTHSSSQYKAECRKILLLAKGKSYGDEDEFDLSYKTADQLKYAFESQGALSNEKILEAIRNTNVIAEQCENFELDKSIKYPILNSSPEEDEEEYCRRAWESLDDKLSAGIIPRDQEAAFRVAIEEELRVFKKLKMCGFMLSMSDLIRWCKSEGMAIGTARGSVGGSRCAYVTDIIDLNPETWHTVFSRFCNEDRTEIGDIDVDVVYDDRPKIFDYITNRFGADKTARVAAYGTLANKSVVQEICRALSRRYNGSKYSIQESNRIKKEFSENDSLARSKYKEVFYYYDGLVGTKVSQSVHPAGMVISPISLDDTYGMFLKDGEMCLLLDMDEAHEVGAAKYDFLALKTVKVIRDTCSNIGCKYPNTHEIDWTDQNVWDDLQRSQTSIFQFESAFAAECLRRFHPTSIFDMSLVTACIRPTGSSYRDKLLRRELHHNPSNMIDDLFKDNLGYLVYQEDTIKFLQDICGLSGSEADNVRRAIGRKQKDRLDAAMPAILEGYCSKSDKPMAVAETEAKEFLQIIEDSANYQFGFNHSIAYCLLGYFCAYYRYYYPVEYTTAFLNNAANDDDLRTGAELAKLYGIKITTPKWGVSSSKYTFDKGRKIIAQGLDSVKFMSSKAISDLNSLYDTKFERFVDVLSSLDDKTCIDARQLDTLIKLDFFSEFGNQKELLRISSMFSDAFNKGHARKIRKAVIDGGPFEGVVKKYSVGVTKSGGEAKSYTLLDVMSILRETEDVIKSFNLDDLSDIVKVRNFYDIMGYIGYVSGKEEDRRKLYVIDMKPIFKKSDGAQCGYSVFTKSIGSGKESRFTVFNSVYNKNPIQPGDIIYCNSFQKDGIYFKMLDYTIIY